MHYTPYGKEAVDKSKIGFYFYPKGEKPSGSCGTLWSPIISSRIPAGVENHKEVGYAVFPKEAMLHSVFLHTHYRGSAGSLDMVLPDGTKQALISLPRYDFNWQRTYSSPIP